MRACGVIAEWNPFHNGHAYLLQEARRQSQADLVVAVMSGNYCQRGEPAIASKWDRAYAALANGADLVVELPVWWASQSANYFSQAALAYLRALGCQDLAFGVETADFEPYLYFASWLAQHPEALDQARQAVSQAKASHADQELTAWAYLLDQEEDLAGIHLDFEGQSNSLLAMVYALTIYREDLPLTPHPIQRQGDGHRQDQAVDQHFVSGTYLRQALQAGAVDDLAAYMPEEMLSALAGQAHWPRLEGLYPYIRYLLLVQDRETLARIHLMAGGIEGRLQDLAHKHKNLTDFLASAQTRSWPVLRLQRLLLMLALQVSKAQIQSLHQGPQPLFLLAANQAGRAYCREMKKHLPANFRWIGRVDRKVAQTWPEWLAADRIYSDYLLQTDRDENFGRWPLSL
ncbi:MULTISPECIES: nucleotidyltransferase family protein [Aerococcus]|uniref:tRNA(Met) cytidine acetate ligase n=1 Tax=Aerococcus sanguinicola TaxID=119206 RepID=A0A5N1GJA4_9LACT|nr:MULTISPECIES: nucleotidyltransferase family protein [Aerococcus]KAA9300862.1 nucleotidyltransferase family protein [Aerococcus sanguinicola]MDK6369092.1 nucleotidyltransferase family protein [Aerococcus sp. UMB9870]MDK6679849.1 nucleotidyltransferase family protein [Aerococcus sp. UMB8608]MDK6686585.1 nucleotidyltransferase family protein [Aerococcus sp. UMB8623]MDK6939771.1 nucleotidyltransferase family protein [Aerococcus sp. UMB8487]